MGVTMSYPCLSGSGRRAFTLIELLVVIAVIALLAGILLPTLIAAIKISERIQCLAQLKNIGVAVETYRAEFGSHPHAAPRPAGWQPCPERQLLQEGLCAQETFFCPSDRPNYFAGIPSLFEDPHNAKKVQELFWFNHDDGTTRYARQMDRFDRAPPFEWLQSSYMWNESLLEDEGTLDAECLSEIGIVGEGNHVANRRDWGCLTVPVGKDRRRDQVHWMNTVNFLFADGRAETRPLDQAGDVLSSSETP